MACTAVALTGSIRIKKKKAPIARGQIFLARLASRRYYFFFFAAAFFLAGAFFFAAAFFLVAFIIE